MTYKLRNYPILGAVIVGVVLVAFTPLPRPKAVPSTRNFQVAARNFAFSPAEFYVNPGDRVTFELSATDVVHGLYIDGYDLEISAEPGKPATLSFVAEHEGVFRLRCSVTCGDMHPFMIGKLQVGPNTLLWRGIGITLLAIIALIFTPRRHAL